MQGIWSVGMRAALLGFERIGLDAEAIRAEAGLSPERLEDPDARFTMAEGDRVWQIARAAWDRPGVALHAGRHASVGAYDALDHVVATMETVRERLDAMARYSILITNGATRLTVGELPERELAFITHERAPTVHVRDWALAVLAVRIRSWGVEPTHAEAVGPRVAGDADYRDVLGCQVTFEAEHTRLFLPLGALDRRLECPLASARPLIEREARRLVTNLDAADDPLARARYVIAAMLGRRGPALREVAARLGTSPRTLQRRLREADTTFRELVDSIRSELAKRHLSERALSVGEIGWMLGYSDVSAFHKAFKRWTGTTPAAYRADVARATNHLA